MRSISLLLIVSYCISGNCHANASLPPILNSYPKCDYKVLEQAVVVDKTTSRYDDIEVTKQTLRDNTLHKMRLQAAAKGADAILLTDVQGTLSDRHSLSTIRYSGHEIKYRLEAEFISLCQDDASQPTVYAPFNSAGLQQRHSQQAAVATTTRQFKITLPVKASTASNVQLPLASNISLEHGFYGVKIGMTTEQVHTLFGLPDAELTLTNDNTAWIYGQEHLLIFAGNKLSAISQTNSILSAEVRQRLAENPRFQQHEWTLDSTFNRRTSLTEIKAFYQDRLIPFDRQHFALKNEHSQLNIHFAPYLDVKNNSNQQLLVNVSLVSRQFAADIIQLKLPDPDLLLPLKSRLTTLATSAAEGPFIIPEMIFLNHSKLRDGNELTVLSPTLALSHREGHIGGLTITNILNDYAVSDIQQQLAILGLPATRDDFMTRFSDAFDSLNQLTLYGDHSEIKATYNSDELIDSLNITWY